MTKRMRVTLVAMLFVGLAAAAFAWWTLQPRLSATYAIYTGGRDHPTKHFKYFVTITQTAGNADRIDVTVAFQRPVTVYNQWLKAPDGHALSCDVVPVGLQCRLGPMDAKGEYAVVVTADSLMMPVLTTSEEGVRLRSTAEPPETPLSVAVIAALAILAFLVVTYRTRSRPTMPVMRSPHW